MFSPENVYQHSSKNWWSFRQYEPTLSVTGSSVVFGAVLDFEVDGRLTGSRLRSSVSGQQKNTGQRVLEGKHGDVKI